MSKHIDSCVLVRVAGMDARRTRGVAAGYKMHDAGDTYLSCSGVVFRLPGDPRLFVVCHGAVVAPFVKRTVCLLAERFDCDLPHPP